MSENRQPIYTDVDGGVFTIEVIDTDYGKIPVRKYLHTNQREMSELDRLTRELVKQMVGRDVDDEQDGDYQIAYHYLSKAMKLMEEECIKNYKAKIQEDIFKDFEPNEALKKAAEEYKRKRNL